MRGKNASAFFTSAKPLLVPYYGTHIAQDLTNRRGGLYMLYWAIVFLVIAIIAGVFGVGGIAGAATDFARVLFFIFLILLVLSVVAGRTIL